MYNVHSHQPQKLCILQNFTSTWHQALISIADLPPSVILSFPFHLLNPYLTYPNKQSPHCSTVSNNSAPPPSPPISTALKSTHPPSTTTSHYPWSSHSWATMVMVYHYWRVRASYPSTTAVTSTIAIAMSCSGC